MRRPVKVAVRATRVGLPVYGWIPTDSENTFPGEETRVTGVTVVKYDDSCFTPSLGRVLRGLELSDSGF